LQEMLDAARDAKDAPPDDGQTGRQGRAHPSRHRTGARRKTAKAFF
jgi:hypothetical protein